MPQDVKDRLVRPPVRPDEEDRVAHDQFPARSSGLEPSPTNVTTGRSNAALCIAVYRWIDGAKL
jgi:hypothetical protein